MTNVSQRMLNLGTARSEIRGGLCLCPGASRGSGRGERGRFSGRAAPAFPPRPRSPRLSTNWWTPSTPSSSMATPPPRATGQARAGAGRRSQPPLRCRSCTADNFCSRRRCRRCPVLRPVCPVLPGDTFIAFAPYFPEYKVFVESAGAELVTVPADIEDFQIDFAAFDQALTPNTKGVIINSPNNPTGVVYSEATIQKLAQVLTEKSKEYGHAIWLISDEPYREIVYRDTPLPWVPNYYPNTLVCYSYSKSLSPARAGDPAMCSCPPRRRMRTSSTPPCAARAAPWAMSAPPASSSWWRRSPARRQTSRSITRTATCCSTPCGTWATPVPSRTGPSTSSPAA